MWNLTKQDHLQRYMYLYKDWELPTWSMVIDHYKMNLNMWMFGSETTHVNVAYFVALVFVSITAVIHFLAPFFCCWKFQFNIFLDLAKIVMSTIRMFFSRVAMAISSKFCYKIWGNSHRHSTLLCILFIFLLFTILFHSSG